MDKHCDCTAPVSIDFAIKAGGRGIDLAYDGSCVGDAVNVGDKVMQTVNQSTEVGDQRGLRGREPHRGHVLPRQARLRFRRQRDGRHRSERVSGGKSAFQLLVNAIQECRRATGRRLRGPGLLGGCGWHVGGFPGSGLNVGNLGFDRCGEHVFGGSIAWFFSLRFHSFWNGLLFCMLVPNWRKEHNTRLVVVKSCPRGVCRI